MVRRKEKFPLEGEMIIGRVAKVNPYSAFIKLDEYPIEGMIHISEVARKWVKDIRTWVKEGNTVVCLVLGVEKDKGHVNLSLKRVDQYEKNRRLQQWKRDSKGEKFLLSLAKEAGLKGEEEMYGRIGFAIQESFKDMLEVFELAQKEGVEGLVRRGLPKDWAQKIEKMALEKIAQKETTIKGFLALKCPAGDGIETIKKALTEAKKAYGLDIRYIAAGKYSMTMVTKDPKKGQKVVEEASSQIKTEVEKSRGECRLYESLEKMPKV